MPDAAAWKSRSIYQVLTDRFAVTDPGNGGPPCDHTTGQYCGGTWQGIISKLDYIQGMGFDAVWISPVTKNIEDPSAYGHSYHGYWQEDIYSVNPHFGCAADLFALSNALHARGMFLMVDVVVNHMGSPSFVEYSRYTPFNDMCYFHPQNFIKNYEDQRECEQGWLGDNNVALPDLDTEHPDVAHTFSAWIALLVRRFRIDGLRIDTVKHVPKNFWPGFIRAAGVWSVGEVLSGDPDYLSAYQPYCGGLLDYGTFYPLKRAFKQGSGSMYEITSLLTPEYRAKFTDMQQLATFMENHDMPRFPHDTNSDLTVIMNALSWTILTDGIPILYYGQEQSFSGGDDPKCREVMWASGFKITPLYQYIGLLNRIRKLSWDVGFGTSLTLALYTDVNIAATQKGPLLMVLSNEGSKARPNTIKIPSRFVPGTVLVDVLTSQSIVVQKSTKVTVVSGKPHLYLPLPLASQICSNIIPPTPTTHLFSFFSMFKSKSSKKTVEPPPTPSSWSSGIPIRQGNPNDILAPTISIPPGRVLQPERSSAVSEYSIFSTSLPRPASSGTTNPNGKPNVPYSSYPATSQPITAS